MLVVLWSLKLESYAGCGWFVLRLLEVVVFYMGVLLNFLLSHGLDKSRGAPCSLWCVCVSSRLCNSTIPSPHPLYTFLYHSLIYHYILCVEIGHKSVEIAHYKCVEIGHIYDEIVISYIYLKIC